MEYRRNWDIVIPETQICYELPLNKVFQAVKNNAKLQNAIETIKTFFIQCTNADFLQPKLLGIRIWNNLDKHDDGYLETIFSEKYGNPKKRFDGYFTYSDWELTADDLPQALEIFGLLKKVNVDYELKAVYKFDFKEPQTSKILSCNPRKSELTLFFGKNTQAMPEFWFPFTTTEELHSYLAEIEPFSPFKKWDMKAFRIVKSNKQGTANVARKIKDI